MPKFNDLQVQMLRAAKFDEPFSRSMSLCALGLTGEAGEIADLVKKVFYHHHEFNRAKFVEEGGDLMWYVAYLCKITNINMDKYIGVGGIFRAEYKPDSSILTHLALRLGIAANDLAKVIDLLIYQNEDWRTLGTISYTYKTQIRSNLALLISSLREIGDQVGTNLEEMCQVNIEKLRKRYPDGFSTEASLARVDAR